jgi:hypothetical protein
MRILSWLWSTKRPIRREAGFRRRLSVEPLEDRLCLSSATLDFSTFLGGSGVDVAYSVAVDGAGNSYVTGSTSSKNFPATSGAFQTHFTGNMDAFVAKFSPAGALIYATYFGGRGSTVGQGIAVDQYGDAYLTGMTSCTNLPVQNAFQSQYGSGGQLDAFVARLNPNGSALLYSTYLGGTGTDSLGGPRSCGLIAVDANGNAYVTGSAGTGFPTLNGLPATTGGVFVTRLNTNGAGQASLVYSTLFNAISATAIAADSAGDAYVTGLASSSFITTPGAYLTSGAQGYVARLNTNAAGSAALVYATYLSAQGLVPHAIAVDQAGDAYVAGLAQGSQANLPVTANAFQANITLDSTGNAEDAFVLGLNPSGSGVTYASYLGGSWNDWANAIAIDSAGHVYISGVTGSRDFPTLNAYQGALTSSGAAFVAELDPNAVTGPASLIYSTYLGGTSQPPATSYTTAYGIAVDGAGDVIVVGQAGPGFPTLHAFQSSYHGAFVTKIAPPVS